MIVTVFLCSFLIFFFLTRQQVHCLSTSWSLAAQVSRRRFHNTGGDVWKKQRRRLIKTLHVSLSILTLCATHAEIKWKILPQENHQNAIPRSRLSLTLFVSSGVPCQTADARNAIGDLLPLTLIKMEHVQEIKLSLSCCNEMVSIMILFTSQSDKMIKLKLNQGLTRRRRRNLLALLF